MYKRQQQQLQLQPQLLQPQLLEPELLQPQLLPEQLPQQLQPQLFIAGKPQPPQLKRMRIRMMIHQLLLLYIDKYLPNHCFQTIL